MALVDRDLSEPYSIFTYRYFLSGWPQLCVLVRGLVRRICVGGRSIPSLVCVCPFILRASYTYLPSTFAHTLIQAYGTDDKAAQESGQAPLLGVVVGKADTGEDPSQPSSGSGSGGGDGGAGKVLTGYIAMLAVETSWRRAGIGSCVVVVVPICVWCGRSMHLRRPCHGLSIPPFQYPSPTPHHPGRELVRRAVERMRALGCHEVALETEVCNAAALGLYERLGFAREERMLRYYLNGGDAFRLKLWLVHDGEGEGAGGELDLAVGVTQLSLGDSEAEAAAGVKR